MYWFNPEIENMKVFLRPYLSFFIVLLLLQGVCSIASAQLNLWQEVPGSSIVNQVSQNAYGWRPMVYNNGNLYVPYYDPYAGVILSIYNGSTWQYDTVPYNFDNTGNYQPGYPSAICVANNGTVYLAAGTDSIGFYVVMAFDGANWTKVGYGPNDLYADYYITSLCMDANQNLLATGYFTNDSGSYLAKWDGNTWSNVGNFILNSQHAYNVAPHIVAQGNYVYVTGVVPEPQAPYYGYAHCIFRWDGNTWINYTGLSTIPVFPFIVTNTGIMYAGQGPGDVYSFNGTTWTEIGSGYEMPGGLYDLQIDNNGNLYAAVNNNLQQHQQDENFVSKWDGSSWTEMGVNNFSLHANNFISSIAVTETGKVYATGAFTDAISNNYVAVCNPVPANTLCVFLTPGVSNCGGNDGSVSSAVYQGTPPYSYAWSNGATTANIDSVINGVYYVTVTDNAGRVATGDIVLAATCQTVITGHIFNDTAHTCSYNGTQPPVSGIELSLQGNGRTFYANTDDSGAYYFVVADTGTYIISVGVLPGCGTITLCGNQTQTIAVTSGVDTIGGNNFGSYTPVGFNLALHPGWTPANPGFTKEYWVMPYNTSPHPVNGPVTIVFAYDSVLTFDSATAPMPVVDSVAHTLTWTISGSNVPYPSFDWNNERFECYFQVPGTLSLNYQLKSSFVILPVAGDCDSSNNNYTYTEPITGSHDPNFKQVSPAGSISAADSVLTYTIYFQNDGTDSTHFIVVSDTLSGWLDPTTVINLASSAPYTSFKVSGNGVLTWLFLPYSLVDSAANPAGSVGFITFSIKKKANTPIGTYLKNTAFIYFDYNPLIKTNTVTDSVNGNVYYNITASICTGDTLHAGNFSYNQTGIYADTLITTGGYDSIININLTVSSVLHSSQSSQICNGDSALFNSHWYKTSGTYSDTLTAMGGCDSVVSLTLNFYPSPSVTFSWDSLFSPAGPLIEQYYGNYPNLDTVGVWCLIMHPNRVPVVLKGGKPEGGIYTGNFVRNSILYSDSNSFPFDVIDTITYTYTDVNGCSGSSVGYFVMTACEGISEILNNNWLNIYPNPVTDNLFIKTENMLPVSIDIYDADGRKVYATPYKNEIDIHQLSGGVYFVEVKNNIAVARKMFVKM